MIGLLALQTALAEPAVSVPDRWRWLEHLGRDEVVEWWKARREESRAWVAESGQLDRITAWLAAYREREGLPPRLVDHRGGVSLWTLYERELKPSEDEEEVDEDDLAEVGAPPPDQRWVPRLHVQQAGEEFPGTPVALDEARRFETICQAQLAPDGRLLLLGRSVAWRDLDEKERKTPRDCVLELLDLETGAVTELGGFRHPGAGWPAERGQILVSHDLGRRNALDVVDVATGSVERVFRSRYRVDPWVLPDGTVAARATRRSSRRLLFGDLDEPRSLGWVGSWPRRSFWPEIDVVGWTGEDFLLRTPWFGAGHNVVRVDPEHPLWWKWRVPVEERPGMDLREARLHGDDLLLVWSRAGQEHLEVRPYELGIGDEVDLGPGVVEVDVWRHTQDVAVVEARTPLGTRWYGRDQDGALTLLHEVARHPGARFETVEIEADDGALVPVSLVTPEGPPPAEGRPVLLYVYGGFGISTRMYGLAPAQRLWLEAGGAVGTIHARGGRELGERWHHEARKEKHARTFDDVVAVARALVARGLAAEGKVAISGTSNGGLTVVAAAARAPDAFGAVIAHAGVYDLLRAEQFGHWWPDEYGALGDREQAAFLRAESPVHRVPAGALPPVLLTTGVKDPVVDPAHSLKLAAAWAEQPGGPVLLEVDPWGSHGGDPSVERDYFEEDGDRRAALELAFLARALDLVLLPPEEP